MSRVHVGRQAGTQKAFLPKCSSLCRGCCVGVGQKMHGTVIHDMEWSTIETFTYRRPMPLYEALDAVLTVSRVFSSTFLFLERSFSL